jgi:hypothetical protein
MMTIKKNTVVFSGYSKARDDARNIADSLVGQLVDYYHGGHYLRGEVLSVHDKMDTLKIKAKSGKEYFVFWSNIIN